MAVMEKVAAIPAVARLMHAPHTTETVTFASPGSTRTE